MLSRLVAAVALLSVSCLAADTEELKARRKRAAETFQNGIILLHAKSVLDDPADGFRQEPIFYYFTGLENTAGAILAIDGRSSESWLFLPTRPLYARFGEPEGVPDSPAVKAAGIEHVVDWAQLENYLADRAPRLTTIYFLGLEAQLPDLPPSLASSIAPDAPLWISALVRKWPSLQLTEARPAIHGLLDVQTASELPSVRAAASSSVRAVQAGLRAIRPGMPQKNVESAIDAACRDAGAHGVSFWPWSYSGDRGVFPRAFLGFTRYDHLNGEMKAGDLTRLDVGCEVDHYEGDLGRTVPVSGRFTPDQKETWNIFVAAYQAAAKQLREGITQDQIFETWRSEIVRQAAHAKSDLAKRAVTTWATRSGVPYWQMHTMNLVEGLIEEPLRAGMTICLEPMATVGGQGYYLEDMFLITKTGAELLTPGVPYTADEIEAAMRQGSKSKK